MTIIRLRKKQVTILELAGLTAWTGICLSMFRIHFFYGVVLLLWTISALIAWFITNSKWSIFEALFAGTFCVMQSVMCSFAVIILLYAYSDFRLPDRLGVFLGGGILVLGAIIGGIVGSYLHFSIVDQNQDA